VIRPRQLVAAGLSAAVGVLIASGARAQDRVAGGRIEISAGVMWAGHSSLGSAAATETAPSGRFTLFSTSTDLAAAAGVEARVGVKVTPVLELEASSSYVRPRLDTAVSGDVENGAAATASESFRQFAVSGAVLVNVARWRIGRRATPFALAGAGYLRELHEGDTLAVGGQTYFAGGGIKYLLASRPHRLKGVGVRADVRALVRRKGVAFDTNLHTMPVVAASLFVRF
jgi:opacity protein-like surface antigen